MPKDLFDTIGISRDEVTNLAFFRRGDYSYNFVPTSNLGSKKIIANGIEAYVNSDNNVSIKILDNNRYILPEDSTGYFADLVNCKNITGLVHLDWNKVKNATRMFANCKKLEYVTLTSLCYMTLPDGLYDGSSFDAVRTSTRSNRYNTWYGCLLECQDNNLGNYNTEVLENMTGMFANTPNLYELGFMKLNTRNVTTMRGLFQNSKSRTLKKGEQGGVDSWNVDKVEDASYMYASSDIEELDEHFKLPVYNAKNISYMFAGNKKLKNVVYDFNEFNNIENTKGIFDGCPEDVKLSFSKSFGEYVDPADVVDDSLVRSKFIIRLNAYARTLKEADRWLGFKDNSKTKSIIVKRLTDGSYTWSEELPVGDIFANSQYEALSWYNDDYFDIENKADEYLINGSYTDISNFDFSRLEKIAGRSMDEAIDFYPFIGYTAKHITMPKDLFATIGVKRNEVKNVTFYRDRGNEKNYSLPSNLGTKKSLSNGVEAYVNSNKDVSIKIPNDVRYVLPADSSNYFANLVNCDKITGLIELDWNKVENASRMFANCQKLTYVTLTGLGYHWLRKVSDDGASMTTTGKPTKETDVDNYKTGGCRHALYGANLGNFNTEKLTDMSYMFAGTLSLKNCGFKRLNTKNVTTMRGLFKYSSVLSGGDSKDTSDMLSSWNADKVEDAAYMYASGNIESIHYGDQKVNVFNAKDISYMYAGNPNLKEVNYSFSNFTNLQLADNVFDGCPLEVAAAHADEFGNLGGDTTEEDVKVDFTNDTVLSMLKKYNNISIIKTSLNKTGSSVNSYTVAGLNGQLIDLQADEGKSSSTQTIGTVLVKGLNYTLEGDKLSLLLDTKAEAIIDNKKLDNLYDALAGKKVTDDNKILAAVATKNVTVTFSVPIANRNVGSVTVDNGASLYAQTNIEIKSPSTDELSLEINKYVRVTDSNYSCVGFKVEGLDSKGQTVKDLGYQTVIVPNEFYSTYWVSPQFAKMVKVELAKDKLLPSNLNKTQVTSLEFVKAKVNAVNPSLQFKNSSAFIDELNRLVPSGYKSKYEIADGVVGYVYAGNKVVVAVDENHYKLALPANSSEFFAGYSNVTKIDGLENVDATAVKNVAAMFKGNTKLTEVDMSSMIITKVTNCDNMFNGCKALKEVSLPPIMDTSSVSDMSHMFSGCVSLSTINNSHTLNFSSATNTEGFADGAKGVQNNPHVNAGVNLNVTVNYTNSLLNKVNLSNVKTIEFTKNKGLTGQILNLAKGINSVTTNDKLIIDIDNNVSLVLPSNSTTIFTTLQKYDVVGLNLLDTSKLTTKANISYTFKEKATWTSGFKATTTKALKDKLALDSNKVKLASTDHVFMGFKLEAKSGSTVLKDFGYVTEIPAYLPYLNYTVTVDVSPAVILTSNLLFNNLGVAKTSISKINFTTTKPSKGTVKNIQGKFYAYVNRNVSHYLSPLYNEVTYYIEQGKIRLPEDSKELFSGLSNVREIKGLNVIDFSVVKNIQGMFKNNSKLTTIDFGNVDLSKVTNISEMFSGDANLSTLNNFKISTLNANVTKGNVLKDVKSLNFVKNNRNLLAAYESIVELNLNGGTYDGATWFIKGDEEFILPKNVVKTGTEYSEWFSKNMKYDYELVNWKSNANNNYYSKLEKNYHTDIVFTANFKKRVHFPRKLIDYVPDGKNYNKVKYINFILCNKKRENLPIPHKRQNVIADGIVIDTNIGTTMTIYMAEDYLVKLPEDSSMFFRDFSKCIKITGLDLLDTSDVTNMQGMFYFCYYLEELDLSSFNTAKVKNFSDMFWTCSGLTSIKGIEKFDTSSAENMSGMFSNCSRLTNIDVSNFNTSLVKDMSRMFSQCNNLKSIDVSNFKTSEVEDFSVMFNSCSSLSEIDVSNFDTSNACDLMNMFLGCESLIKIMGVENFKIINKSKIQPYILLHNMFNGCKSLTSINIFKISQAKSKVYCDSMFEGCSNLENIYATENWDKSLIHTARQSFKNCSKLKNHNSWNNFYATELFTFNAAFTKKIDNSKPAYSKPNVETYIKEIKLIQANKVNAEATFKRNGYTMLDTNLNNKTSGKEIYLGYITTTNKSEAITAIGERWFNASGRNPQNYTGSYHKYLFTKVTDFGGNHLNTNEGGDSAARWVYLYTSKDKNAGQPIKSVEIISSAKAMSISSLQESNSYTVVTNSNDNSLSDFNRSNNSNVEHIYIRYTK